jgi:hypothetical protein
MILIHIPNIIEMDVEQLIYIEVTARELKEIERGLKTLKERRESARRTFQRRMEKEGRTPTTKGKREDPVVLRFVNPIDIILKYGGTIEFTPKNKN